MKHVYPIVVSIAVVASLLVSNPAKSHFIDGNELWGYCNDPKKWPWAANYIVGAHDAFLLEINERKLFICSPDRSTRGQIVDVVCKYLKDHPEKRHQSGGILVFWALYQSFPCQ